MMLVRSRVAASPIEGLGVYADEFIPSGTLLWQLNRDFVAMFKRAELEQFPPHIREFVEKYSFPDFEDESLLYVELDNGRFMNHSEAPNTDFTAFNKGYALRDIEVGEEITCNYYEFDSTFRGFGEYAPAAQRDHGGLWAAE
jgi:SET domain-containing protein